MAPQITLPVKMINGVQWADLSANYPQQTHIIVATACHDAPDFSLYHNHGLRQRKFKHNVHWRVATGFELDISGIAQPSTPAMPPRAGRRHDKGR